MQPLEKTLRNRLEGTVTDARTIAETAAKATLDQLSVGEAAPWYSMEHSTVSKKVTASMIII